jgi:lipid II:glycine glycyltransferase (peptidoglycan interpeptide bridge formation enzyme)
MFTHTLEYRDLLSASFDVTPHYLVATDQETVVGALPTMIEEHSEFGNVLNSLPFFGSPGGLLVSDSLEQEGRDAVLRSLRAALQSTMEEYDCVAATVITPQMDGKNSQDGNSVYEQYLQHRFKDKRTAQILDLGTPSCDLSTESTPPDTTPPSTQDASTIGEYLFTKFEKRCRRAVRKPYKQNLEWEYSSDFSPLFRMHKEGMESKGGRVKPRRFFTQIPDYISDSNYKLLYTRKNGEIIAGLLLFFHDQMVEYFTPAYEFEHRDDQATSMLIFEAMKQAVANGYRYWNFGGTLASQESLHRFKRGWGATDYPYHYYTIPGDGIDTLLSASVSELSEAYEWSYAVPFSELEQNAT